ncbi:MAG: ABC transporter substrate-binding protein [Chloroflexota bacterium]|nr:sugar ABC transporter substrate-binding protein [Chloroflexota bacterium]NOG65528.1 sugar ABC transporter substrate-binding protein [Chloroflexota bacterium]GIK65320.1 MAG: ABC transporter substrate-binding protein [Chloroflexota bacterium]
MFKRLLVLVILAALLLPIFAVNAQDEITLRWRTRPDNQAEIDVYQAASDEIEAAWDGVTLQYEPGGSETASYQDVLITELTGGTAPDVFWIPGTDVARFAKLGLILNLNDLAAQSEGFSIEDFYPQIMEHLTYSLDGSDTLWGLPRDASAFAIYYNEDLFDEAGLDYPAEGWTWEDFRAAGEEITALGGDIKGFGMSNWWGPYGYFINAAGSSFFNEDYTGCGLANENTVTGLDFMASLYNDGLAVPYGEDPEPVFLAGNVGMFMNGRWATPGVVANATFGWNVAELPVGPGGPSNWLFWGAYVVNANTEHPQEAWELVMKLTSPEIQGKIAGLGANIPSRVGGSGVDDFLATFADLELNNQAFVNGLGYGVAENPVWAGDWSSIGTALDSGVAAVVAGDLSAQEFADTICAQVDPFFATE